MKKPKIYFVGGSYLGCYYVRCFLPMIENGWLGNYRGISRNLKPVDVVMREMLSSDIVVFHRADTYWHHKIGMILREAGKKIVFDNDDTFKLDKTHAFYGFDDKGFEQNSEKVNNVINNFILNADLVTASTEFLADEYRQINSNVIVLPNCVNPDDWPKPKRNEGDKVRIGVVGSTAYYHDFDIIEPVIKELDDDPNIQLVLFGLHSKEHRKSNPKVDEVHKREYSFWDTLKNVEHAPWCQMTEYFKTLNDLRLDLMIIPRRESDFNRAKSNLKFLEAAMLDIPCIVSSFDGAPYEKDIDGTNGILVKDHTKWKEEIYNLVNNKNLRVKMGKKAHEYVLKNYNIADNAHKWAEAYQTLYEKN